MKTRQPFVIVAKCKKLSANRALVMAAGESNSSNGSAAQ